MSGAYDSESIIRDFHASYGGGLDSAGAMKRFRSLILSYYRRFGRHDLPWRESYEPYRIVVSEIMLQQTQVHRVIGKYREFLERFPGVEALARGTLEEVLRLWQGLGYNRRGKYLLEFARAVMDRHGGIIPDNPEALRLLPGIGAATAASITVFAFNKPVPFIETNVRTVYIHFFFPDGGAVADSEIEPFLIRTMDMKNPRRWFSAIMDYGTMIKKLHGNTGRRSVHYKKQSPFRGSRREGRGMVLKYLLGQGTCTMDAVARACGITRVEAVSLCRDLEAEGLLKRRGKRVMVTRF